MGLSHSRLRAAAGLCLLLLLEGISTRAAVEVLPEVQSAAVFGSGKRSVRVLFRNPGDQAAQADLRWRLYQASAGTLAPLGETRPWRAIPLGAGQIVVETVELDLPGVRGEIVFHIVWFDGERKVGTTPLRVFPEGLLNPLATLAGDGAVGLVDPEEQLKGALTKSRVQLQDLREAEDISAAETQLILVAPMSDTNRPAGLSGALKKKALAGAGVVWVRNPVSRQSDASPESYVLEQGAGRVVIASSTTIGSLAESPRSQLKLVRLAELAVGKLKLEWPGDPEP